MEICQKLGVKPSPPISATKVGIALDTIGKLLINGIRHAPENGTNGVEKPYRPRKTSFHRCTPSI